MCWNIEYCLNSECTKHRKLRQQQRVEKSVRMAFGRMTIQFILGKYSRSGKKEKNGWTARGISFSLACSGKPRMSLWRDRCVWFSPFVQCTVFLPAEATLFSIWTSLVSQIFYKKAISEFTYILGILMTLGSSAHDYTVRMSSP